MNDSIRRNRYYGAVLGAVIGDALGWPFEDRSNILDKPKSVTERNKFFDWARRAGGQYYRHIEMIKAGEYSDDSQLLLATARSLTFKQDWSKFFLKHELTSWLLYQRGAGGATIRAAESWSKGIVPWKNPELRKRYFEAGGNGVAMRILPHIFASEGSFEEIAKQVTVNGISTHGHPRALLGALIYAYSIYFLVKKEGTLGFGELIEALIENEGEWRSFPLYSNIEEWLDSANSVTNGTYLTIWENTVLEIRNSLVIIKEALNNGLLDNTYNTLSALGCFDPKIRGAGTIAALSTIYISSKYAADPETGLLEVLCLNNSDTDTLASMVGGIFGCIYGTEWIKSDWIKVQDQQFIEYITKQSYFATRIETQITPWMERDNYELKQKLKQANVGDEFFFGPFKKTRVIDVVDLQPEVRNLRVVSTILRTDEGQTLYIKNITKLKATEKIIKDEPTTRIVNDSRIRITSNQVKELSTLFPGRLSCKRAFNILISIFEKIEHSSQVLSRDEVESFSSSLVQPGITCEEVKEIINYIVDNTKRDKR